MTSENSTGIVVELGKSRCPDCPFSKNAPTYQEMDSAKAKIDEYRESQLFDFRRKLVQIIMDKYQNNDNTKNKLLAVKSNLRWGFVTSEPTTFYYKAYDPNSIDGKSTIDKISVILEPNIRVADALRILEDNITEYTTSLKIEVCEVSDAVATCEGPIQRKAPTVGAQALLALELPPQETVCPAQLSLTIDE